MSQHVGAGTVHVCRAAVRTISIALFGLVFIASAAHAQSIPSGWYGTDIGSPVGDGSVSYSSGTFTLHGPGVDIWGTSDELGYVYQRVSGDVNVVARVASLQGPDHWSKAGIMIRTSLAANSGNVFALVSLSRGIAMQSRPAAGLLTTQ